MCVGAVPLLSVAYLLPTVQYLAERAFLISSDTGSNLARQKNNTTNPKLLVKETSAPALLTVGPSKISPLV